jgi:hypothetical protein
MAHMNGRIAFVVFVAFLVGGVAGAVAEHERVAHKKKSAGGTTTTTVVTVDWFGSQKPAACPALRRYATAATTAYKATLAKNAPWATTSATLAQQNSEIAAAFTSLVPMANPAGAPEIQYMITYENQLTAAIKKAASLTAYKQSEASLTTARASSDGVILGAAANSCPAS